MSINNGVLPIALTMGDPSGIAPDITLLAWKHMHNQTPETPFFYIGDADHLAYRAELLGLSVPIQHINNVHECATIFHKALPVLHTDIANPKACGQACPENAPMIIQSIKTAVQLTTDKQACAIVTNPINKAVLYSQGFNHHGHTEFLASLTTGNENDAIMMLTAQDLRVVPLTTHVSLKDAIHAITPNAVTNMIIRLHHECIHQLGITNPRIAVAGLNPHAGEGGSMGYEDMLIITPAIEHAQDINPDITVSGPLSADTLFHSDARKNYDIALCMYHDQALIPVKTIDFHGGVNVTLGLPITRTSPDHGTAFPIAGTGTANPNSLINAITTASHMATTSQNGTKP